MTDQGAEEIRAKLIALVTSGHLDQAQAVCRTLGLQLDLRNMRYVSGDLRGADLRGADLRGAFIMRANLADADLRGADLRLAMFRYANLRGARYDRATRWSFWEDLSGRGVVFVDDEE